jgi:hypothetical protein
MGYERLAYDDQDTTHQMHHDCDACVAQMHLPAQRAVTPEAVTGSAPSLTYDEFPHQAHKPDIEVSDAAAHLASRLHLHLD